VCNGKHVTTTSDLSVEVVAAVVHTPPLLLLLLLLLLLWLLLLFFIFFPFFLFFIFLLAYLRSIFCMLKNRETVKVGERGGFGGRRVMKQTVGGWDREWH